MQNGHITSLLITLMGWNGKVANDVNMNPTCSLSYVKNVHSQCNNNLSSKNDDVLFEIIEGQVQQWKPHNKISI
jgi:hypothetical protein